MWRGRDRQPPSLGSSRPRHRSESRRLSDRRRPAKAVARNRDHCPDALHEGDAVRVFSRSAKKWVDAEVVKFVENSFVRVEYEVSEWWCGKTLHVHSEHLAINIQRVVRCMTHQQSIAYFCRDVDGNLGTWAEARAALQHHAFIRGTDTPVTDAFDLVHARNNSFATKMPLEKDYEVEYCGSFDEDVLLKVYTLHNLVYTLHNLDPQYQHAYDRYVLHDYVHAMQEPRFPMRLKAGRFVGLAIHKDLNKDWLWNMEEDDYNKFISRSTQGGWKKRGDPLAKSAAADADYLISFTTGNKEQNDDMLERISTEPVKGPHGERPITFCTDRSLGFGGHFHAQRGLYLAKHGFGQPTAQGKWFEEYANAAKKTRYGMLILNYTSEYVTSKACRIELTKIPVELQHLFIEFADDEKESRIVPWKAVAPHCSDGGLRQLANYGLMMAVFQGDIRSAERLLSRGADPNFEFLDVGDRTSYATFERPTRPLHFGTKHGLVGFVASLIDARADWKWQNPAGKTALMEAARSSSPNNVEIVRLLLAAGATEPGLPHKDAFSAIEWLQDEDKRKFQELMSEFRRGSFAQMLLQNEGLQSLVAEVDLPAVNKKWGEEEEAEEEAQGRELRSNYDKD